MIAVAEFKLKYTGSALGYAWSVLKPLALFTLLYLVFGRVFNLNELSPYYAVSLLLGIVLFTFFADATMLGLLSIVARDSLIRKMSFPRIIITTSVTLTAAMTLLINLTVVAGFVFYKQITPQLDWLLIPLLLRRAVRLHPRRLAPARRAVRSPPRPGTGLGARAPASLLRVADHLSDRVSSRRGRRSSSS